MNNHDAEDPAKRRPRRDAQASATDDGAGHSGSTPHTRRGSVEEYLSAWGPGGWSREHGRERHGQPTRRFPRGQYDRGYRGGDAPPRTGYWGLDDGAPTG